MRRSRKLSRILEKRGVDAIIVANTPDENFFYVTGFEAGEFEGAFSVVFPGGKTETCVSILEYETARRQGGKVAAMNRKSDAMITGALKGAKNVGVVAKRLPYSYAKLLENKGFRLIDVSSDFMEARRVKDKDEIKKIEKACAITSGIFGEISEKRLFSESETAGEIERLFLKNACEPSFKTICAADANSAIPHHFTGRSPIRNLVLLDFGARFRKYCSDMSRCVVRRWTPALRKMNDTVMKAYDVTLAKLEEMPTGIELQKAAESVLGDGLIHSIGHSLGIDVHEGSLSRFGRHVEPGMVITIEPALYERGVAGIRYENDLLITRNGFKVLTKTV